MASERPAGWLEVALEDLRWLQIVLLSSAAVADLPHPKLLRLDPRHAVRVLAEKIPHWRQDAAGV